MLACALLKAPPLVAVTGAPTFTAPHLARLATTFGSDIAWRAASFERGIAGAAAGTTGAFAVGLTDDLGHTALAVDRFGIHSLCYRLVNGELRFAPRADTLADAHSEIDPQAIFDYLFFHSIPSPRTMYKGIYRLPPAHCAELDNGALTVAPYWQPTATHKPRAERAALRDELLQLLCSAVGEQLDGSTPACFLGGGTDSCTVAALLGRVSGRAGSTYSVGYRSRGYDDLECARQTAKSLGTRHHECYVTPDDLVRSVAAVAAYGDQPFGNAQALPAYHCAAMARADGVTRLLSGEGGDALLGCNARHSPAGVLGWYGVLPGMRRADHMDAQPKPTQPLAQSGCALPPRHLYNLLNRLGMERVFLPHFLHHVDPMAGPARRWQSWRRTCDADRLQHTLDADWRHTLADNDFPNISRTSTMAGVSVGFALLDQRLLDFSLRLLSSHGLRGPAVHRLFKDVLRALVPQAVLRHRGPQGGIPVGMWLCQHAGLQALARESLRSFGERGVVRRDFIAALLDLHLPQHPAYYGEMVWLLMVLEQWLRTHAPFYRYGR